MTPDQTRTADRMKSVKSAWDAGLKSDAALKRYHAAEKATAASNDADTNKELNAATHALA